MTRYTFVDLFNDPALAASFDPALDVLDLMVPANQMTVLREGAGLSFTTAAGTVLLPVSWDQIANPDGSSDVILCSSGRLVIGDDALADTHLADPTAGDQFHGRGGDDSFIGGLSDDIAYGNKGTDYLFGSAGDDTLYGGQNDSGTEVVAGGVGNDLIYGNLGADSLIGDGGDDVLYGGQGDDWIATGGGVNLAYGNKMADTLLGGGGNDSLYGGQGNDRIEAGAGTDLVYGNLDEDILSGGDGADTIYGGQGNDWIVGGGGDDVILANRGSDSLYGGTGADIFHFRPGGGANQDVIYDYSSGDSLVLTHVTEVSRSQQGNDALVTLSSGDSIRLVNTNAGEIQVATAPSLNVALGIDGTKSLSPTGNGFDVTLGLGGSEQFPAVDTLADGTLVIVWDRRVSTPDTGLTGVYGQRLDADGSPLDTAFLVGGGSNASVAGLADGGFVVTWLAYTDGEPANSILSGGFSIGQPTGFGIFAQRFAAGGTPVGGEFRVNTSGVDDQLFPEAAALAHGGFVIVWQSEDRHGGVAGIFGQVYGADGMPQGSELQISNFAAGAQQYAELCALDSGGFVVTWQSLNQDGDGWGVYARQFAANGDPVTGEFRVNTQTVADQRRPDIVKLADGDYLIAWTSTNQDGDMAGIFAQRYGPNGAPVGREFQVNLDATGVQNHADILARPDGGFLVTWMDGGSHSEDNLNFDLASSSSIVGFSLTPTQIEGRLFDADGTALGPDIRIYTDDGIEPSSQQVIGLANGSAMVAWASSPTYPSFKLDWTIKAQPLIPGLMEDGGPIPLIVDAALSTADGTETLSVVIEGVPAGASLSAGSPLGGGAWSLTESQLNGLTLTAPDGFSGDIALTVAAISTQTSSGVTAETTKPLAFHLNAVADIPILGAPTSLPTILEDSGPIALGITAGLTDPDGSERLSLLVRGMPIGASLSAGTALSEGTTNSGGTWSVSAEQLPGLALLPAEGFAGTIGLTIIATASESATVAASASAEISVSVTPVDDVLTGTAGADTLTGGGGNDTLTGGGGNDRFLYTNMSMDGHDLITDFTISEDTIDLAALLDTYFLFSGGSPSARINSLTLSGTTDTVVTIGESQQFSITLAGVAPGDLTVGTDIWVGS